MSKIEKYSKLAKDTEVKFMLKSENVLTEGFGLNDIFKEKLNIKDKKYSMKIWYLDTLAYDLNNEDWIVRYRYHDGCDFELTFKKRFDLDVLDVEKPLKDEGITQFLGEDYKPEIDMGYRKQTLSFSYTKKFPMEELFFDLPLDEAKKMAIKNSTKLYDDWISHNWGFGNLYNADILGPVDAVEYKSSFENLDISIEVWKLDKYYPELSYNISTQKAEKSHDRIISMLDKNDWLLHQDLLKTQLVYENHNIL